MECRLHIVQRWDDLKKERGGCNREEDIQRVEREIYLKRWGIRKDVIITVPPYWESCGTKLKQVLGKKRSLKKRGVRFREGKRERSKRLLLTE